MHACVCLGMRGLERPGDLVHSVSPSRFNTAFHLGFPKSSKVQTSSHSLSPFTKERADCLCILQGPSWKGLGGQLVHRRLSKEANCSSVG